MNAEILVILQSILGSPKRQGNSEYYYYCPFCHHHNRKLAVNIATGKWHCWVCGKAGRTLVALARMMKLDRDTQEKLRTEPREDRPTAYQPLAKLPDEYRPLWGITNPSFEARRALHYAIKTRGLRESDLFQYQIGYCADGEYAHRLIVPSFDDIGQLNFFVGRDYLGRPKAYHSPRASKDIIPFDLYINWDYPVILVEGVFDAIAVRRNAIPLLGKILSKSLREKILLRSKEVYIALDLDARADAEKMAKRLKRDKDTLIVKLVPMSDKDPGVLGFTETQKLISQAVEPSFGDALFL